MLGGVDSEDGSAGDVSVIGSNTEDGISGARELGAGHGTEMSTTVDNDERMGAGKSPGGGSGVLLGAVSTTNTVDGGVEKVGASTVWTAWVTTGSLETGEEKGRGSGGDSAPPSSRWGFPCECCKRPFFRRECPW